MDSEYFRLDCFQRLVELALAGLTWEVCLAYLDDLIIFVSSIKQHLERLQMVLDRLVDADLKLKRSNGSLFRKWVKFLRSIISEIGIEPDPEKNPSS